MTHTEDNALHIVNLSGGKDSAAVAMLAKRSGIPHRRVFCDTGNEADATYEYIDYLEGELGPIDRIKADFSEQIRKKAERLPELWSKKGVSDDKIARAQAALKPSGNPFLDLCLWKGLFPSTKARFCTQELKVFPMQKQVIIPALKQEQQVNCYLGVRADESRARASLPFVSWTDPGYWDIRPILKWSANDVFDLHHEFGIKPNPLYKQGMNRVGCFPCIMCRKGELRQIVKRFPEAIDRLREWEAIVSEANLRDCASFFPHSVIPGDDGHLERSKIDKVAQWALTSHGGRQLDLLSMEEPQVCESIYGLCE